MSLFATMDPKHRESSDSTSPSPTKNTIHITVDDVPATKELASPGASSASISESDSETKAGDEPEEPYHIFSRRQKWNLVYLVSLAGCFSPLSSNIYFPAVNTIAQDLHVSNSLIALTITIYMIVQGIAPSLFGAVSDATGRRVTFALTLLIYTSANIALSFTNSYGMLMALRGLQAFGSSATISISAGVIADIASPCERGGFMGTNAGVRMMGQAIGPIIGGSLNHVWGFRGIFWFLFALSLVVLLLLLVFLPETQRSVAGNGSVPLKGVFKPWIYYIREPKSWAKSDLTASPRLKPFSLKMCIQPLMYVFNKDIFTLLAWGALVYTLWSMVTSSTTSTLLEDFELNQWQLGLCFLPNGLGCVLGSVITGRLMDRDFKRTEKQYREKHKADMVKVSVKGNLDFPLEQARLRMMPYLSVAFLVALGLYGPSFEIRRIHPGSSVNLAAPLILQSAIAFTATAIFNLNSTILVDCFPNGSAGATATNNLCRCLLGAIGVSIIEPMINCVGVRNAFLILTGIGIAASPLVWVQFRYGPQWRQERDGE